MNSAGELKSSEEKENAVDIATGKTMMAINSKFYRPAEAELLIGDLTMAKGNLCWES
jgi:GDPmannose 4,6-dehydratase